jgi:hypothetical protein
VAGRNGPFAAEPRFDVGPSERSAR